MPIFYRFPQVLTFRGEEYALYMCGLPNGSSSLFCLDEDGERYCLHIFDAKGRERKGCSYDKVDSGVLYGGVCFPNDSYAVFKQRVGRGVDAEGTFYFPEVNKHRREVKFDDIRVFANNWFALYVQSGWVLYDNEGKVRADSDFCDVRVFPSGYALHNKQPGIFDDEDVWSLYSADDDSEPLRTVKGVEDFVGDGFVVVKTNERKVYSVQYFDREEKLKGDVYAWHTFPGGRFYLCWGWGPGKEEQVFTPQGEALSTVIQFEGDSAPYPLSSGYYVVCVGLATTCPEYHLYDPKGNKEGLVGTPKRCGDYYLVGSDLYDVNAKCIGSGYKLVGECGIFQIFTKLFDHHLVYEIRNNDCSIYNLV